MISTYSCDLYKIYSLPCRYSSVRQNVDVRRQLRCRLRGRLVRLSVRFAVSNTLPTCSRSESAARSAQQAATATTLDGVLQAHVRSGRQRRWLRRRLQ